MPYSDPNRPLNVKSTLAALTLVLVSLIVIIHQCFPESVVTEVSDFRASAGSGTHQGKENLHTSTSQFLDIFHHGVEHQVARPDPIPNIVHFVHLVDSSLENPGFEFLFRQFIAVYSAWYHLHPETIYIHTNVEGHLIQDALKNTTNPYTQAISKLEGVKFRHHKAPNETSSGIPIAKLPNQSDFVRTEVLQIFGGIYLDADAYVLRDLKPLRSVGFENVVGRQENGELCPAVILSTPKNNMMQAYHALQDSVFNPGSWAGHATGLLSRLVIDFKYPDHQVLILPQDTFFPLKWLQSELEELYQIHYDDYNDEDNDDDAHADRESRPPMNVTAFVKDFKMDKPRTWKRDWRLSYVLHGWTSGIRINMAEEDADRMFRVFEKITLAYVMARNSNFARAVYPAVKHAVDHGVLKGVNYTTAGHQD